MKLKSINGAALLVVVILSFCSILAQAQDAKRYYITFTGKDTTAYQASNYLSAACLENRTNQNLPIFQTTDIPVSQEYVAQVSQFGIAIQTRLRWFNAIGATMQDWQVQEISKLSFVKSIMPINGSFFTTSTSAKNELGAAVAQINGAEFIKRNLTGKGVVIGLIDAGFLEANGRELNHDLFKNGQIKKYRDFVNPDHTKDFFAKTDDGSVDTHGATVLSYVAGKSDTKQTGLATDAKFYLARTDNAKKEFRAEEDYWLAALEFMDSSGVRLINTSLGYAKGFDNPEENHKKSEIDGKTCKVTLAATLATTKKGIFLVVSAGNEGEDADWGIIASPADCPTALTLGATYSKEQILATRADYSSFGPEALPYLKPNVACHSMNGTSFSAPVMTGFAACIMQKYPKLTVAQLLDVIQYSGSLAATPNNYLGHGIPDAARALALAEEMSKNGKLISPKTNIVNAPSESFLLPITNPKLADCKSYLIIDKNADARTVISETVNDATLIEGKLLLKKQPGAKFSTIQLCDGTVVEIKWPEPETY